jgi:hypothetical protein
MNYETIPDAARVEAVAAALKQNGFESHVVATGAEALELAKTLVPAGSSVMNGTSTTLQEIGFVDYLKSGEHGWRNLHAEILAEQDPEKQAELRRYSVVSDAYFGSVHAITDDGRFIVASASGSQLPHIVYTSRIVVLIASTNKIAGTMPEALKRLREHVVPLEDARMQSTGAPGTVLSKILSFDRHPGWGREIHVILVNEKHGF